MKYPAVLFSLFPLLLLLVAACAGHRAQWVEAPDHTQAPPPVLIRGVQVFDGILGELSPPMDVLLARGRVLEMLPEGRIAPAPGLHLIDGRGKTLLPGLVDAAARVGPEAALHQLEAQLAGGTMTALLVGNGREAAALQRSIVQGKSAGPRIFRSTRTLALGTAGEAPWQESGPLLRPAAPLAAARAARQDLERLRPDLVLVRMEGAGALAALRAVVAESRIYQKPVLALAIDAQGALDAAAGGADAILLDPRAEALEEEAALELAYANRPVVLSIASCRSPPPGARADDAAACRERAAANARTLWAAQVPLLAGSGAGLAGVAPASALREALEALVAAGIPPGEVLLMATSRALRLLDPRASFGVITKGSYADLILVEGDPLEDLAALGRIEGLWQAGHPLHLLPGAEEGGAAPTEAAERGH